MPDVHEHLWIEEAPEATIALVAAGDEPPESFVSRLGPARSLGALDFDGASAAQGDLYDDGSFDERAVIQAGALPGTAGTWLVTVEPNGYRADFALETLAAGRPAMSLFWNINSVMRLRRHEGGREVVHFDPLTDEDEVPGEAADLPFGVEPAAASLALFERWTGVTITREWFCGVKPTYLVDVPLYPPG